MASNRELLVRARGSRLRITPPGILARLSVRRSEKRIGPPLLMKGLLRWAFLLGTLRSCALGARKVGR
jgi:hypothetical protein